MAKVRMPAKLIVCVVWMVIGAVLNLAGGGLLTAGIEIALIVGVLVGNDGVRTFLKWASLFQAGYVVMILGFFIHETAIIATRTGIYIIAIAVVFGVLAPLFLFWALGKDDVREWMFRKNFHIDDSNDGTPSL
jgi:hypothetical protein